VRALVRFQAAGLSWPQPEELTDTTLEARLFAEAGTKQGHRRQVEPDWASIHREVKRKHVTCRSSGTKSTSWWISSVTVLPARSVQSCICSDSKTNALCPGGGLNIACSAP
jgi:hypothetical protein